MNFSLKYKNSVRIFAIVITKIFHELQPFFFFNLYTFIKRLFSSTLTNSTRNKLHRLEQALSSSRKSFRTFSLINHPRIQIAQCSSFAAQPPTPSLIYDYSNNPVNSVLGGYRAEPKEHSRVEFCGYRRQIGIICRSERTNTKPKEGFGPD